MRKKNKLFLYFVFILIIVGVIIFIEVVFFSVHKTLASQEIIKPNFNDIEQEEGKYFFNIYHIEYILKNLDFYKLHTNFLTREPAYFELMVLDSGQKFYVLVYSNFFIVSSKIEDEMRDLKPDLIIYTTSSIILDLLDDPKNKNKVEDYLTEEKIRVNILKDRLTLLLKGYLSLRINIKN